MSDPAATPGHRSLPFFQTLLRSCVDPGVAVDAARASSGQAMWYFARVLILAVALMMLGVRGRIHLELDRVEEQLPKADIPEIALRNGEASVQVKQPWVQRDPDGSVVIIDTTGKYTELPPETPQGVLLTKTQLHVVQRQGLRRQLQVYELRRFPNFTFNRQTLQSLLAWCRAWGNWLILLFLGAYLLVAKSFQAIVAATLLYVFASGRHARVGISACWNVTLVAMTCPVLLLALCASLSVRVPLAPLLYYGLLLSYLIAGARRVLSAGRA